MKNFPGGKLGEFWKQYAGSVLMKRMVAVLAIDMLVKLSGIILIPVYLRLMTQTEYGLYNYLLSIVTTFSLVLNFGLYIPLTKLYQDFKEQPERGRLLFSILSQLFLLLSIVLFIIYFFGIDYFAIKILFRQEVNYEAYRIYILLAIVTIICNFMLTTYFFTSEKIKQVKVYNIWRIICINAFSVFLLIYLKGQDSVKVRLQATYLVEFVLFLYFFGHVIKELRWKFDKALAIRSLKIGLPVMLSAVFGVIINFSDKFFLEKTDESFKTLSVYYLAASCTSVIPTIFASFQNAYLPMFYKEKDIRKNVERTNRIVVRLMFGFLAISLVILIGVAFLLQVDIIKSEYNSILRVMPIMLITQIIVALTPVYGNYLVYFEKTYIITITGSFICLLALGLGLLLIPRWGIYGAALVSLVANLVYLITYITIVKKFTQKHLTAENI